jgi:hypothetical protein
MLVATALALPEALGEQPAAQGIGGHLQAAFGELLGGEGGAEVGVVLAVELQDTATELGILAVVGGVATQAMDEGGVTLVPEAVQQATQVPGGELEQGSGLDWGALSFQDRPQDTQTIAFPLAHGNPVSFVQRGRHTSSLPGARRTFLSR